MKGVVKWFDNSLGYGFIETKYGEQIYVHYSNINMEGYKEINSGDAVIFDVIETKKGPSAVNINIVKSVDKR
ncbi:MAG: cold shock domain-containing protein [Bacilli bacterium]|nr:cold shock domain-containing protein [Bacilli bacterium]